MCLSTIARFGWGCVLCLVSSMSVAQTKVTVPDLVLRMHQPLGDVSVPDIVLIPSPPLGAVSVPDIVLATRPPLGAVALPDMVLVPLPPLGEVAVPDIVLIPSSPIRQVAVGVPEIILVTNDERDENEKDGNTGSTGSPETGGSVSEIDEGARPNAPTDAERTWCGGNYSARLGKPRVIPTGPPIGRAETATAVVSSTQCTGVMNIVVNGMSVAMTRTPSAQHVGTVTGDGGQTVIFYLTCNADHGITGYLQAEDTNIKIQRDIKMTRTEGNGPDLSSCDPDVGFAVIP